MREHGISWSWFHFQKRGALAPAPPSNIVLPTITPEATLVGGTFNVDEGTWAGNPVPTLSYQWKRDGVNIVGATNDSYTTVSGDLDKIITCLVTATNSQGSVSAIAGPAYVVSAFTPINTVLPVISGTMVVGNVASCSTGTWTYAPYPAPTFTYQWKRNGVAISGATASTYTLQPADAGTTLTCTVTATNSQGSSSATATGVTVNQAPSNTVAPTITGDNAANEILTCATGTWAGFPAPTYAFQWIKDDVDIGGATSSTYLTVLGDQGSTITCRVTASNAHGSASAVSSNSIVITDPNTVPVNTVAPVISGIPQTSQTLSCTTGTWTAKPAPTFTYDWRKNGVHMSDGNVGNPHLLTLSAGLGLTTGDDITCTVTATNSEGAASAGSNTLEFEQTPTAPTNDTPPSVTPTVAYGDGVLLTCAAGVWSGFPAPTFAYQWLRDNATIGGATSSTYTTAVADVGTNVSCVVTATNTQGSLGVESNDCVVETDVSRLLLEDGNYLLLETGGYFVLEG